MAADDEEADEALPELEAVEEEEPESEDEVAVC